jgi:uncharacterized membrane protein YeiH
MCVEKKDIGTHNISSATSSQGIYLRSILVLSSHPRYITQAVPSPPLSLTTATLCTCLIACMRATLSAHLIILDAITLILHTTQYCFLS